MDFIRRKTKRKDSSKSNQEEKGKDKTNIYQKQGGKKYKKSSKVKVSST